MSAAAEAAAPAGLGASSLRVVSYNVLSSHLSSPSYFTQCAKANLKSGNRLKKVLLKLGDECDKGSVICLQEVSTKWAGDLHCFFLKRGYTFVFAGYGSPFNGYMGVALAWPVSSFEALEIEIPRISETRRWGAKPAPGVLSKAVQGGWSLLTGVVKRTTELLFRGAGDNRGPIDEWNAAASRFNRLAFARLRHIASDKEMFVGNYHMPCMFFCPPVMVIHTAMAAQYLLDRAKGAPCVLAGDFNFKPGSACYRLVTEGRLDETDAEHPRQVAWEPEWESKISTPLKSAYNEVNGREPDFTNYAQVRDEKEPFIDCLDYVFFAGGLEAKEVKELRHRDDVEGPLPNDDEPSDHVMIAAQLEWTDVG